MATPTTQSNGQPSELTYTLVGWNDNAAPALNATNLNNMDNGISNATQRCNELLDRQNDILEDIATVKTEVQQVTPRWEPWTQSGSN